ARERYATAVRTGRLYAGHEYAEIVGAQMLPAPEEVATALGVAPGDPVARRHRVNHDRDVPTATSWSWFTADVAAAAPGLLRHHRVREGTTRYVELATGRHAHTGRDWWTARLATEEERELLRLDAPAAVAEVRHLAYDTEGRALAYEVGISPAGRWTRTDEYPLGS
ncbi:UTRA domain-containing protein, partial [Streptomyces sp. UNOB3_S3]|uniref:UTRA domain-containing protein n=1 Tax=Streptomyces sp. UNOB3_S3 TaxID=2871682 RepID=UPI001E579A84